MSKLAFSVPFSIISNKPTTTNWRIWCVSRFHVNKNIKQTYKGGLHFTVICCTNKCIINERYIPEHQNKLNIYDLQNYEFLPNFSTEKKISKICYILRMKKIRKIRILDLCHAVSVLLLSCYMFRKKRTIKQCSSYLST